MATAGEKLAALRAKVSALTSRNGKKKATRKPGLLGGLVAALPDIFAGAGEAQRVRLEGKSPVAAAIKFGQLELLNYSGVRVFEGEPVGFSLWTTDYQIPEVGSVPLGPLPNYGLKYLGLKVIPKIARRFGMADLKIPFLNMRLF